MKYIDADKLKAEIERLYEEHISREYRDEAALVLEKLEDFLDTLPEQPVTNCNWLVSEINKKLGHDDWLEVVFDRRTLIDFAGHFYALGLNARKDE